MTKIGVFLLRFQSMSLKWKSYTDLRSDQLKNDRSTQPVKKFTSGSKFSFYCPCENKRSSSIQCKKLEEVFFRQRMRFVLCYILFGKNRIWFWILKIEKYRRHCPSNLNFCQLEQKSIRCKTLKDLNVKSAVVLENLPDIVLMVLPLHLNSKWNRTGWLARLFQPRFMAAS